MFPIQLQPGLEEMRWRRCQVSAAMQSLLVNRTNDQLQPADGFRSPMTYFDTDHAGVAHYTSPQSGARTLIRTLVQNGVTVCFTNPGTSEMHFVAGLDEEPEMRPILVLQVCHGAMEIWHPVYIQWVRVLTVLFCNVHGCCYGAICRKTWRRVRLMRTQE